jgi:1-acyl-sn-glycerol-3-phosphate acyltransferase
MIIIHAWIFFAWIFLYVLHVRVWVGGLESERESARASVVVCM